VNKLVQARKLKGFQDLSPHIMFYKWKMIETIVEQARLSGFQLISTPSLEYAETLLCSGGIETDKQVFRFLDHGGRDVALRFDLTIPFARFVAENLNNLVLPFKRIQIGDVWRGEKPQKGRFRQFTQCDLDIIGTDHLFSDVDILLCFANILSVLGLGSFTFRIGHRQLLSRMIYNLFPKLSCENEFLVLLDKLDKLGYQTVQEKLVSLPEVHQLGCQRLFKWLSMKTFDEYIDYLHHLPGKEGEKQKIFDYLRRLQKTFDFLREPFRSIEEGSYVLDLSIARGLGYYTGMVFETFLNGAKEIGSICSGGRYDELAQRFMKTSLPGVGGSIGLDRLLAASEIGVDKPSVDVFIAIMEEANYSYALKIMSLLQKRGIRCITSLRLAKLRQQFRYAHLSKIPFVVTVGQEEVQTQTVSIKVMLSGQEMKKCSLSHMTHYFLEHCDSKPGD